MIPVSHYCVALWCKTCAEAQAPVPPPGPLAPLVWRQPITKTAHHFILITKMPHLLPSTQHPPHAHHACLVWLRDQRDGDREVTACRRSEVHVHNFDCLALAFPLPWRKLRYYSTNIPVKILLGLYWELPPTPDPERTHRQAYTKKVGTNVFYFCSIFAMVLSAIPSFGTPLI